MLRRLILKHQFDEECILLHGCGEFTHEDLKVYRYWGERLAELQRYMQETPPLIEFRPRSRRWTPEGAVFTLTRVLLIVGVLVVVTTALQCWLLREIWKQSNSIIDALDSITREIDTVGYNLRDIDRSIGSIVSLMQ